MDSLLVESQILSYSLVYLSSHIWLSSKIVMRVTLSDDSVPPLSIFMLTKYVRGGMAGEKSLGKRELNFQPGTSIFSGTFQSSSFQS